MVDEDFLTFRIYPVRRSTTGMEGSTRSNVKGLFTNSTRCLRGMQVIIYFYYIIRITKNILIQSINHEITLILNTDFFELFVISR